MYSEFHPAQHDAWLEIGDDAPIHFMKHVPTEHESYEAIRPHLTFPRPEKLQDTVDRFAKQWATPVSVQITGLSFDLPTGQLGRATVLAVDAGRE